MRASRRALRFIAGWEGFRKYPYQDQAGVWTQGYGETQGVTRYSPPVSRRWARRHLRERVNQDFAPQVEAGLRWDLRQSEFDALVSFTYNMGVNAFYSSTLRRRLNEIASHRRSVRRSIFRKELPRWVYADGEVSSGLVLRRAAEVRVANRGDYTGRP